MTARTRADRRLLVTQYPALFVPIGSSEPKRPIKLGIHMDLLRRGAHDENGHPLPMWRIRNAIYDYVKGERYTRAMALGGPRFDLDGNPCGEVREESRRESLARIEREGWDNQGKERAA